MPTFTAQIEPATQGGAFVVLPGDVYELLGGGGRIPVIARFDGIDYAGSVVRMGGRPILGIRTEIREELGKDIGDTVEVEIQLDTSQRTLKVPDDLAAALNDHPEALAAFERLPYSHQKQYVDWIEEARRPDTRTRRIERTIERVR